MDAKVADEVKKHFSTAEGTISLTGGAKKWICIPCKKPITGSATKLRAHLLGTPGCGVAACPNVSEDAKNAIRAAEQENPSNKRKESAPSFGLSASGSNSSSRQRGIAEVFKRLDKTEVDQAVAGWFYVNGIPFNTVRYGFQVSCNITSDDCSGDHTGSCLCTLL
jgi:hypothetical protein